MSAAAAKLTIYRAFIEGDLDVPRHLARRVHELYFNPQHEEFQPRTMWSLSNAFTSAFKELDPIPQFRATAKLAGFLQSVRRFLVPTGIPRYGPDVGPLVSDRYEKMDRRRDRGRHRRAPRASESATYRYT